jgi:hypothetical protein
LSGGRATDGQDEALIGASWMPCQFGSARRRSSTKAR